jgi:small-conductance mechanosensitive channel
MNGIVGDGGFAWVAVNSVLAIGGVGGLAVGLAGREILENLFTGLIILSSRPFDVGDEVLFTPPSGPVRTLASTC